MNNFQPKPVGLNPIQMYSISIVLRTALRDIQRYIEIDTNWTVVVVTFRLCLSDRCHFQSPISFLTFRYCTTRREPHKTIPIPTTTNDRIRIGAKRMGMGNGSRIADRLASVSVRSFVCQSSDSRPHPFVEREGEVREGVDREWATQIAAQSGQGVELGVNEWVSEWVIWVVWVEWMAASPSLSLSLLHWCQRRHHFRCFGGQPWQHLCTRRPHTLATLT